MRLRRIGLTLGLCVLALLLLSALVESPPAAEAAAPEGAPLMVLRLPAVLPAPEGPTEGVDRPAAARAFALLAFTAVLALPAAAGRRDANGRVLRSRRYVRSVYQVYRQEAASG